MAEDGGWLFVAGWKAGDQGLGLNGIPLFESMFRATAAAAAAESAGWAEPSGEQECWRSLSHNHTAGSGMKKGDINSMAVYISS